MPKCFDTVKNLYTYTDNIDEDMKKVIAITGPTASGKSAAALELCQAIGGEIVSCDSMQIYKGMDIGTAKPTQSEQNAVRHHMIDVVTPDVDYSCADYAEGALRCIDEIISRGRIPVICGGTGMYFERLFFAAPLASPPCDPELRALLEERTSEENYGELMRVDPVSAEKTHANNRKRVIRALEIYRSSGKPKSVWDAESLENKPDYDLTHVTLVSENREYLYSRIDKRVDIMMEQGLENEVRGLCMRTDSTAGQAIGYKELMSAFAGEMSAADAVSLIKQRSRNYAKRQLTWFRRYGDAIRYDVSDGTKCDNIVNFLISLVDNVNM